MNDLINNNEKFINTTTTEINNDYNKKFIDKMNDKWNINYKNQTYIFMTCGEIFTNNNIIEYFYLFIHYSKMINKVIYF